MAKKSLTLRKFILRRAVQAVPLLLGVVVVNFTIIHLAPGDPITVLVGDFPAPPDLVRALRHDFGLDRSLWQQLLIYVGK